MPDVPATKKLTGHTAPVYVVEYLKTKPLLVSGSFDNTLRLWDTATLKSVATWGGHTDLVLAVAIAAGDKNSPPVRRIKRSNCGPSPLIHRLIPMCR